jgi:hypothetical protein
VKVPIVADGMADTTYEFRISGSVPAEVLRDLGDVSITMTEMTTLLAGKANDQSALLGILARLRALGLHVIEVHRVLRVSDVVAGEDLRRSSPVEGDVV